ncbi:hypothetical protein [Piscinibacter terrae]|uniref:Uncharacterized protein n=1 Tax=Piscinibacter terrae TaxID=2496871 RepID=A0A3N7HKY2_9BURK|nr:hypothetical protein [Albitalea terrae]RQP22768.1 hypothetical protein DZC73_20955 [Albitalea terrae]
MFFSTMKRLAGLLLCLLVSGAAWSHELPDNRATLVLRDGTHLSMTLFVDYTQALHRILAPQKKRQEFLMLYAAMAPQQFEEALGRAQAKFEAAVNVALPSGGQVRLSRWNWPAALTVQQSLREQLMQAMVAEPGHPHVSLAEIRAEARLQQEASTMRVQFPQEFGKVLVVSYRPNQVWVEAKAGDIRF